MKTETFNRISKNLSSSPRISRFDQGEHSEADALAHAILDMETEFSALSSEVFPKLLEADISAEKADEIVWAIRDRLRHIVYHIRDCRSFQHILTE